VPLMLLTALFFNDLFQKIPESTLDAAELSNLGSGFQKNGMLYLGYLTRIVAIDHEGNVHFTFDNKGAGPREMRSGGPIFNLGQKVFCHDVMGHKLVRFNMSLEYEKDTSLKGYPSGTIKFTNDGNQIYSLIPQPGGKEVIIEKWDPDKLSKSDRKTLSVDFYFKRNSLGATFIGKDKIALWEEFQVEDHIVLYLYDLSSGTLDSYGFPNPDFDERARNKPRDNHFAVAKFGISIRAASADDQNIYLFVEAYDESPNIIEISGYRYFAIRKEDMELIQLREIPYTSASGHQHDPVQVMKNENGEVVVAHSSYFLKQRN